MKIAGLQKLTLLDYPGLIACNIFTLGCDFRCPFCHNSSLVLPGRFVPCLSTDGVLDYLRKRRGVLSGAVITGGEPTLQPDLADFIRLVRAIGYKIKLDTNGTRPDTLSELIGAGLLDYIAMDVKASRQKYPAVAGTAVDVAAIARSVELIRRCAIPHEFRTTLVKGLHDTAQEEEIARWVGDEKYFIQSYVDSGEVVAPEGLSAFSRAELDAVLAAAKKYCPQAELRI